MLSHFSTTMLALAIVFYGCKGTDCGTQTYKVGAVIENKTDSLAKLSLLPKMPFAFLQKGQSDQCCTPKTEYDLDLEKGASGFHELWEEERSISSTPRGKIFGEGGKCDKKIDDPRDTFSFSFSVEDLNSHVICRNSNFTEFKVMATNASCPDGFLRLIEEANGPVVIAGENVEKLMTESCTIEYVKGDRWSVDGAISFSEQKQKIADSFALNCDLRSWFATLRCADKSFQPQISSTGAIVHCGDSAGNIRKADSFQGQRNYDAVFCTSQGKWIKIISEAHATTHYLFCITADLRYSWPWEMPDKGTPYRSCSGAKQAVLGQTAEDFDCQ